MILTKILLEPYNYLLSLPGQKTRSKLIEAFNHWLNAPKDKLFAIAIVVEMLHAAIAHTIFGVPATINCANYVYFLALHEITKFDNPEMHYIYTSKLLNLHHGQGMELYSRDSMTCPSEDEYINMHTDSKGFCEDLTEEKFSFSIMHSIHTGHNNNRLMNILKQYSNSIELKQYAVKIMKENASL
ncbi:geranylgeranyl pyrophosphate synthase [Gigaspora margarita]|uniref:Geranylgeranyl pyrophosphate synthase n=1 Tax=Gigaspora margarita TaxID=4874 RepID=A0A8H4AXQ7_GIGMA|nr:geranylgeranyl pyrophosphate synthase [Gigaspora margarita]